MNEIIQIVKSEPRVSTSIIAEGLGIEHNSLLKNIERFNNDILDFGKLEEGKENLKIDSQYKIRNKKSKVYYLNEGQSIFIGTISNNTEKTVIFKKKLTKEFLKYRNILNNLRITKLSPEYEQVRLEGKIVRKTFTDTIQILEIYAKKQNPEATTKFLYSTYTKALNNGLFDVEGSFKNIRDVCDTEQLKKLELLENELSKIIMQEIEKETPYKDIYYIIKEKINGFSSLFGKSVVINNSLALAQ